MASALRPLPLVVLFVLLPCCFGSCDDYKSCEECLSGKAGIFESGKHCKWCPLEYLAKSRKQEAVGNIGYCGVGQDADVDNYDGHLGWCTIPTFPLLYKHDASQPSFTVFHGWLNPLRTVALKDDPLPLSAEAAGKACRNYANSQKFEDISLRALDTDRSQTKRGASEDQGDGDLGDTSAEQLRDLFENHELLNLAALDILRVLRIRSLDARRFKKDFPGINTISKIKDASLALLNAGVRFGIKAGVTTLVEVAMGVALPGLGVAIESIEVVIDWVRTLSADSVQARLIDKGREAFTGAFPDITFELLIQAYHDAAENFPMQFSEYVKTLLESDPDTIVKRMKSRTSHALTADAFASIVRSELARIPHTAIDTKRPMRFWREFDEESVHGACEVLGGSGFQRSKDSTPDFFLDGRSTGEEYHTVVCNAIDEAISRIVQFDPKNPVGEYAMILKHGVSVPPEVVKDLPAFYHGHFLSAVRSIQRSAKSTTFEPIGTITKDIAADIHRKCEESVTLDELAELWGEDSSAYTNQDRVQQLYILVLCHNLRALLPKSLKDPDDPDVSDPAYQKVVDTWKESMEEAHFSALTALRIEWLLSDLVRKIEELYPEAGGTVAVTARRGNQHGAVKVAKATVHAALAVLSVGFSLIGTVPVDLGTTLALEKAYSDIMRKKADLLMAFLYFFEARQWYPALNDMLSAAEEPHRRRVVFCDVANGLPRGGCDVGRYCKREWLFWPEARTSTFEFQKFSSQGRCAPYGKGQDRLGKSGDPCLAHLSCESGYCDFPVMETQKGSKVFISANDYRRLDQVPVDHYELTNEQLLALSYGVCKTLLPKPRKEFPRKLWPKGCKNPDARANFLVCSLSREQISKLHNKLELERQEMEKFQPFNDDYLFRPKVYSGLDLDRGRSHESRL
eukprot:gnl/Spiro4/1350_TR721_c0_g1_i1.p1 gnl/Spiro4/1350_TR721_c0_g1~~gnl/Spiro4/1350_TR721_c0_g1_i1.p1  ORF type:complete len:918 (-),score=239.28 gnl/Spiro4/1350_TR721_c0_g1_i1:79-2811(-)